MKWHQCYQLLCGIDLRFCRVDGNEHLSSCDWCLWNCQSLHHTCLRILYRWQCRETEAAYNWRADSSLLPALPNRLCQIKHISNGANQCRWLRWSCFHLYLCIRLVIWLVCYPWGRPLRDISQLNSGHFYVINFRIPLAAQLAITRSTPYMMLNLNKWEPYLIFAVFTFGSAICTFFFFPELKGRSIESMDSLFDQSALTILKRAYPTEEEKSMKVSSGDKSLEAAVVEAYHIEDLPVRRKEYIWRMHTMHIIWRILLEVQGRTINALKRNGADWPVGWGGYELSVSLLSFSRWMSSGEWTCI